MTEFDLNSDLTAAMARWREYREPCSETGKEMGCVDGTLMGYRPLLDQKHDLCNGTGYVQPTVVKALIEAVTRRCIHCYVEGHPWLNDEVGVRVPCHICHKTTRVPRDWEEIGEGALSGRLIRVLTDHSLRLTVRADGSGFVARIYSNQSEISYIAEAWDDGGFHLDGPPDRQPNMDLAALAAVDKALAQMFGGK